MKTNSFNESKSYSDVELIERLQVDSQALYLVYALHKEYCINFMKNIYNDYEEIKDIFQDAVIVFYEKINTPEFKLTCSIQTYLNSICRNQILKRVDFSRRNQISNLDLNNTYLEILTDWFDEEEDINIERVNTIKTILELMKEGSNKCYDILMRFFYLNQSMERIANDLSYTNAENAKNQKYRCQEKLKAEVFKRYKN